VALADLLPARNRTDRSAAAERGASRAEATPHSPSPADAAAEKARHSTYHILPPLTIYLLYLLYLLYSSYLLYSLYLTLLTLLTLLT
jgi:hypothetical protein